MKKMKMLFHATLAVTLFFALAACASTSGAAAGDLSLEDAIEQAAHEIAEGLPSGTRVAIVAFESETEQLSDYIMDELTFALVNNGMEVAERDNLDYVLKELDLQYTGNFSDESMQSIGKFVGAESVISGELVNTGGRYRFRVSPVSVEKAVRQRGAALFVRNDRAMKNLAAALKNNKTVVRNAGDKAGAAAAGTASASTAPATAAPMTAGAYLDRGILFAVRGDFAMAIDEFTDALKLDPDYAAAYLLRGKALLASISHVTSISENFEDVQFYVKTFSQEERNTAVKAISDLTQAVKLSPNPKAYLYRARAYQGISDYDNAMTDCNQAIRLDANYAPAYMRRGSVWYSKKDYDKAIADCNQAIKIDPNSASAYTNRGNAYNGKGDYDRAIADFNQAIKIDPNYAGAYYNRGVAYGNKGDYDRAIADFNQAIKIDPNYAGAYYNRGLAYGNKGDYDRAIADFNQAIRLDPNYATAYNNRGVAYNDKGDYDRAIADYNQAIRLDPNYAAAYNNRGVAYYNKGDLNNAIADWEAVLRIDPNHADAKHNLGVARKKRGW